jgi:hypothetical protein
MINQIGINSPSALLAFFSSETFNFSQPVSVFRVVEKLLSDGRKRRKANEPESNLNHLKADAASWERYWSEVNDLVDSARVFKRFVLALKWA